MEADQAFTKGSKETEDGEIIKHQFLDKLTGQLNDGTIAASGISKAKQQEITILMREIKEQQKHLNKNKLILGCVKEVTKPTNAPNSSISATLSRKVNKILVVEQAKQLFENCPLDSNPLGLQLKDDSASRDTQLTYDEAATLRAAVEERVNEKCKALVDKEKTLPKQNVDKSNLLKLNEELDKSLLSYNRSLMQGYSIVKEVCDSHVIPMAKINQSRAECLEKEIKAIDLKTKFLECKIENKIYTEHENVLPCIEKVDASLKLEIETLSNEITKLRIQKAKYDQLRESEEYQSLVRDIKKIKKAIKDKQWILQQC